MDTTIKKSGILKEMREIKDKLSLEIMNMDFEQQKGFIKNELSKLKKRRNYTLKLYKHKYPQNK